MEGEDYDLYRQLKQEIDKYKMVKDRKMNRNRKVTCMIDNCGKKIRVGNIEKHERSHTRPRIRDMITGRYMRPREVPPREVPPGEVPPRDPNRIIEGEPAENVMGAHIQQAGSKKKRKISQVYKLNFDKLLTKTTIVIRKMSV